jgi:ubiquinone/menaquinone biosynthesis C-methylase UbiE
MNRTIGNVYEDEQRACAYATLEFPGTYYLAFRDLPALIRRYNHGRRALDFGCGTGRSTRFLRNLRLEVVGVDISQAMLDQARARDPSGEYYLVCGSIVGEFAPGSFDLILAAFTFDNIPTDETKADALRGGRRFWPNRGESGETPWRKRIVSLGLGSEARHHARRAVTRSGAPKAAITLSE